MFRNNIFKFVLIFTLSISFNLAAHFYTPERLAFPALCKNHYNDLRRSTTHTWIEPIESETLKEMDPFLKYLPTPYEADCYGCTGCRGMRLSRRDELLLPFDNPKFAYAELTKLHQQIRGGTKETCPQRRTARCESFCWDGGYFRRLNNKYIGFFKEFLVYNSQNRLCKCFWQECHEAAVAINNPVYRVLYNIIEQKLIPTDFSPYWISKELGFEGKKRSYGKEYLPNSHGRASSLATYMFFYSHYQQMLTDVLNSIDAHAIDPLACLVAKDQIYSILDELQTKFFLLYSHCQQFHPHPKIFKEMGLLKMQQGEALLSLEYLLAMVKLAQEPQFNEMDLLNSQAYTALGEAYNALHLYEKALEAFDLAISKKSPSEQLYFLRAIARFEIGNEEEAYRDYQLSKKSDLLASTTLKTSDDFCDALLKGLKREGKRHVAASNQKDFWYLLDPIPVEVLKFFATACDEVGRCFAGMEKVENIPEELQEQLNSYNNVGDAEKGELLGTVIGKHGLSIFSGAKKNKQLQAFKKLQEANYLAIFATLTPSPHLGEESSP